MVFVFIVAVFVVSLAPPSRAQPIGDRAAAAFLRGDYARAVELYDRIAEENPSSFVPFLNLSLAHALSMPPDLERAQANLVVAIEQGFTDLARLDRDPRLADLRATPLYQDVSGAWPRILDARRDASLDAWKRALGPRYEYEVDADRRVVIVSFPRLARARDVSEELLRTERLADRIGVDRAVDERTPWVLVLVLQTPDYARWLATDRGLTDPAEAAALAARLPGQYDHDAKRLVSRDADATLRHEYFHALHHRHQTRLNQRHAPWVLEGLACLAESLDEEGRPLPTDRLDVARRRAQANRLMPVGDLAALGFPAFNGERPLANYAGAYAVWLWLVERSLARDAYGSLVAGVANPVDDEAGFRAWLTERRPAGP